MARRSKSSSQWLNEYFANPYLQRAQAEGWRSRAVFKLAGTGGGGGADMAPKPSGVDVIDAPRSMYLAELALDMAAQVLKPGGAALIKLFQGGRIRGIVRAARMRFGKVKLLKPEASRSRSPEMYLLAMQFRLV